MVKYHSFDFISRQISTRLCGCMEESCLIDITTFTKREE